MKRLCGCHAPGWSPITPTFQYSYPCMVSLPGRPRLLWPSVYDRNDGRSLSSLVKDYGFCLGCSLFLGRSFSQITHSVGSHSEQLYGEAPRVRNWSLWEQQREWDGSRPLNPSQLFIYSSASQQLDCSLISDPEPAESHPNSWLSETVWDHKCLLF